MGEMSGNQYQYTAIVTEMCNLRCTYCYVQNKKVPKDIITDQVIEWLFEQIQLKMDKGWDIKLDIFGGEPLLAWPQVKKMIEKADALWKKNPGCINVTLFTNATLLTKEILTWTVLRPCVNFNFSLDGTKKSHDVNRVYANGRGSYDDVIEGLKMYSKVYNRPMDSITPMFMLAPSNIYDHYEVMREMKAAGLRSYNCGLVREDIWKPEDIVAYKEIMTRCVDEFISDYDSTGFFNSYLVYPYLDMKIKRNVFCGACKTGVGVAPNGDMYPCQRFYNNRSGYKIGHISTGVDEMNGIYRSMNAFEIKKNPKCQSCKYEMNPGCMGQCMAAAYEASGNIYKVIDSVCQLHRINLDLSNRLHEELGESKRWQEMVASIEGEACDGR